MGWGLDARHEAMRVLVRAVLRQVDPSLAGLEDEICDFGLDGLSSGGSPDRLDALIWAVTELARRPAPGPRIRLR